MSSGQVPLPPRTQQLEDTLSKTFPHLCILNSHLHNQTTHEIVFSQMERALITIHKWITETKRNLKPILFLVTGSRLYQTCVEEVVADVDLLMVYMDDPKRFFGIERPPQSIDKEWNTLDANVDLKTQEILRVIHNVETANANILEILYSFQNAFHLSSPQWRTFSSIALNLVTPSSLAYRMESYSKSQIILAKRLMEQNNEKKATKAMYHAIRTLLAAKDCHDNVTPQIVIKDEDRINLLKDIRKNMYSFVKCLEIYAEKSKFKHQNAALIDKVHLFSEMDKFLIQARLEHLHEHTSTT